MLIVWALIGGTDQAQVSNSSNVVGSATITTDEENPIISQNGIHWHPQLSIRVRGTEVPIPANIGLIGTHSPMHTHETDDIIHLEYDSVVRESDITLGKFFEIWGKEFSETQLLENVTSDTERVIMRVNGEINTEYENYVLRHEDEIEISFGEVGEMNETDTE